MREILSRATLFFMYQDVSPRTDSPPAPNLHRTSVLLVDGSAAVLSGLDYLVGTESPRLVVVGATRSAQWACALARKLSPDVIVADVFPQAGEGRDSLNLLLSCGKPVIVLSCRDDPKTRSLALRAGASAFVSKLAPATELLAAIARIAVA